jgi:hypothetical protein
MVYGTTRRKHWYLGRDEESFLEKYKDYCKARETRDEIFCMTQRDDETLEDYAEGFSLVINEAQIVILMMNHSN